MIKILLITIIFVSMSFANVFVVPKGDVKLGYKKETGNMTKKVFIKAGQLYVGTKIKNNRIFLVDKNIWVNSDTLLYDIVKDVALYKYKYYNDYKKEQKKEAHRIADVLRTHKYLPDSILKHIKKRELMADWPESLVVLSWGKPDTVFRSQRGDTALTEIKYGIQRIMLENNKVKYYRKKSDTKLQFMLKP